MKCPVCKKSSIAEFKPFCSKRCQDADLGNWVMEKYRIAPKADDPADSILPELDENEEQKH